MAKPPVINVGKNMDHPHLKGRFILRIWVPVEQAGLVVGQRGEIKRQASVRSIDCPVRSREKRCRCFLVCWCSSLLIMMPCGWWWWRRSRFLHATGSWLNVVRGLELAMKTHPREFDGRRNQALDEPARKRRHNAEVFLADGSWGTGRYTAARTSISSFDSPDQQPRGYVVLASVKCFFFALPSVLFAGLSR